MVPGWDFADCESFRVPVYLFTCFHVHSGFVRTRLLAVNVSRTPTDTLTLCPVERRDVLEHATLPLELLTF